MLLVFSFASTRITILKMRKIFTKRNIIIFIISLVVSTLFWASFFVSIQGSKDGCSYTFLEIIWGCRTVYIVDSNFDRSGLATISSVFQSAHIDSMGFNVPGFLSALFIVLSSISITKISKIHMFYYI